MASLSTDPNGNRAVQFVGSDGKRRSIRLGKLTTAAAEKVRQHVTELAAATAAGIDPAADTREWVKSAPDELAAKLAAVGLAPARVPTAGRSLGEFLDRFRVGTATAKKPATVTNYTTVANDLKQYFGADTPLTAVTPERADEYRQNYLTREPIRGQGDRLASATVARRLTTVRAFFAQAVRFKLIPDNPFAAVGHAAANAPERQAYIQPADADRLLDAANPTWRTIVALARFAGLRCPTEVLLLKWVDVDFAAGRMTVPSPKTEHREGRASRLCPIFAALRPHLEAARERAAPGEVYVVGGPQGDRYRAAAHGPNGWVNANLRTSLMKLIRRTGLTPWPKLWNNLRASCETDLLNDGFPMHAVTMWLGNTPRIALKHYTRVRDEDFYRAAGGAESGARAVQIPVQSGAYTKGQSGTPAAEMQNTVRFGATMSVPALSGLGRSMGEAGLEPARGLPRRGF